MTEILDSVALREQLLRQRLAGHTAQRADDGIRRVSRAGPLALSWEQRRMWILDQLRPGGGEYVSSIGLRLTGPLDRTALHTALNGIAANHEVLRTRYAVADNEPVALIDPPGAVPLRYTDLRHIAATDHDRTVADQVATDRRAVDLATGPVFLARLVAQPQGTHLLVLTTHHIASDEWSDGVVVRELWKRYAAAVAGVEPAIAGPVQYADFAAWQREQTSGKLDRQLGYWRERLAGVTPVALPTDRARPPIRDSSGDALPFTVPAPLADTLRALARQHRASPFMVLLAAFQVLLARYAGQADVTVGVPVACRDHSRLQDAVGLFLNTLVLRTDLSGDPTFAEAVDRVRGGALEAFAHQDLPFERLVKALDPARDPSANPLFATMFVWQDGTEAPVTAGGLTFENVPVGDTSAKVDLSVSITEQPDGSLRGAVVFATALFDRATAQRVADHYVRLLTAAAAAPHTRIGALDMLGDIERHRVLVECNDTAVAWPETTLPGMLAATALSTPDALAVVTDDSSLTYAELHTRANRLAHRLRGLGVGPETVVGVHLDRSSDHVAAVLAVWQAGGVYLPLDPELPTRRIEALAASCGTRLVITEQHLADLEDEPSFAPAIPGPHPDNAAYLIFTSGSSGEPKGVVVTHRGIVNRIRWMQDAYRLGADDRVLHKTPPGFDVSLWELLWPLTTGAMVVVARPGGHRDPRYLAETITAQSVTVTHFVPSMLRAFLTEPFDRLPSLRLLVCSGEALAPDLVAETHARIGCEVHNLYGPTEASIDVTAARCAPGEPVRIGRPVANTRAYIVDSRLRPVPASVPGELVLAGVQLARGYHAKPGSTAERFVPDPMSGSGERLYRTGDLARRHADGTIEYLGRLDRQVKINGHRVEPGEVEAALTAHPDVTTAAVTVHNGRLAACVTPAQADTTALREHLRGILPEPMVPVHWAAVDSLPLTATGKIDYDALPAPKLTVHSERVQPRDALERLIAEAVATAIDVDPGSVGVHDSFFALGGDSIRAIRVIGALRAADVELAVHDMFTHQTVAELAVLATCGGTPAATTAATSPVAPFAQLAEHDRALVPAEVVDAYPMAETQAGMVYEMLVADRAIYQNVSCYRVRDEKPFSLEVLRMAVRIMVERHEILRTCFDLSTYSEAMQLVYATAELPVGYDDLRGHTIERQEAAVRAYLVAQRTELFDVTVPSLVRYDVHQMDEGEWWLTHTECHAVLDGWSHTSVVAGLIALYRDLRDGRPPAPVPPPAVRFADFVAAERESLLSEVDREYWAGVVEGHDKLRIPQAWAGQPDDEPIVVRVAYPDLEPRLRALASSAGASMKSVLHAAHLKALSAVTGKQRFRTGLVANGRPEVAGADRVPGMYLNTVPFPADTDVPTWRDLVARVFATETELLPHRRYPMPAMLRELGTDGPLADVAFTYLDFHVLAGDSTVDLVDDFSPSEMPIITVAFPGHLTLDARPDRIDRARVELLGRTYRHVLEAMAADPAGNPRSIGLPPADREATLRHHTVRAHPTGSLVHQLVESHAAATPDAAAVIQDDRVVSYGELDREANQLAHHLIALGVGPESSVGLYLPKTPELVVAQLATLKAGGAFLPLDPDLPGARVRHMIADAAPKVVLTTRELRASTPAGETAVLTIDSLGTAEGMPDVPDVTVTTDTLAYVIYTSGSTGRPKGVAVPHGPLLDLRHVSREHVDVGPGDHVSQFASMSFDVSVWETVLALTNGATLVLPSPSAGPGDLGAQSGLITHMSLPPAMLGMLRPESFPRLRHLFSAGEALPGDEAARWSRHVRVTNAYGPTEATVYATLNHIDAITDDPWPPIGSPLDNVRAYVLDANGHPVPDGVRGELYLGGTGLARGYLNQPGLTADRFVPDPFGAVPGARMYRTGDVVSRMADGALRYHGRGDHQVKVRGFRIELGEVEQVLTAHPRVEAAAVTVHRPGTRDATLVAYTRPADGPSPAELREHLRARLPEHMVPTYYVALDRFPLTTAGKTDRAALPSPQGSRSAAATHVDPRNPLEQALAEAWADALHVERIGIHDDFFDLGGHSLAMMRVITRLRETQGLRLTFRSFLEKPTIAGLAGRLAAEPPAADGSAPSRALMWLRRTGSRAPLFCVHPGGGSAHWYQRLLPHLDAEIPLAAFEWPDLGSRTDLPSVRELAGRHYAELREARPHGPYRLFAWCGGSAIAAEMAGRLVAEGEQVTFFLLDPVLDASTRPQMHDHSAKVRRLEHLVNLIARVGDAADTPEHRAEIRELYRDVSTDIDEHVGMDLPERGVGAAWPRTVRIWRETMDAILRYPHRHFPGKLHLLAGDALADSTHIVSSGQCFAGYVARWEALSGEGVDVHRVPGDHGGVMKPSNVPSLCEVLNTVIAQAEAAEAVT
ncbi:non-ribosomal peptide synthetase [Kibdelosporangium persicum]|uniref:Non-ribosomal peptide synthetase n=1 Tax=Kibdelosporangium persicum TaxID=2698649 RepID=A0ABX2FGN6_9PSEU|nr:non-ribosomal peptide synthetase [Kibdelosporangium persicum]NRN70398.1 Non-ribosomal peptide synthetase [Kibdelosporangium persicum]